MRIAAVIESLQHAGPLNIVWGAGCSYAGPDAAREPILNLRVNCQLQVAGPEGLHDALMSLDRDKRREKTNRWGIDWAHICLAELLRAGRVARILTANFDLGTVKAATAVLLLPELYENGFPELAASANPCIYSLGEAPPASPPKPVTASAWRGGWRMPPGMGRYRRARISCAT